MTAMDIPGMPSSVTTEVVGTSVRISWSEPFTGGTAI